VSPAPPGRLVTDDRSSARRTRKDTPVAPVTRVLALGPRRWALLGRVACTAALVEPAIRLLPLLVLCAD